MQPFLNSALLIIIFLSFSFCAKPQPTDKLISYQPINTTHAVPFKDLKTNLFGIYDTLSNKWLMPAMYNEVGFIDGDKRLLLVLENEKYKIVTIDNKTVLNFRSFLWIDTKKINENCFCTFESTFGSSPDESSIIILDKNTIQIKTITITNFSEVLVNPQKTVLLTFNQDDKSASLVDFMTNKTTASFQKAELHKSTEYLITGYLNDTVVMLDYLGNKKNYVPSITTSLDKLFEHTYEVKDKDYNHGVINEKGELIIPLKYKYIYHRNSNCLELENKDGKHFIYLKHSNKIIPSKKHNSNKNYTLIENDSIKQIIDTLGNVLFDYTHIPNVSINFSIIDNLNKPNVYTFEKKFSDEERENYYYENEKYPTNKTYEGLYKIEKNKFIGITPDNKYKYMSRSDDVNLFCGHIKLKENKESGTSLWKSEVLNNKGELLFTHQYLAEYSYHSFNAFNNTVIFKGTDAATSKEVIKVFNLSGTELFKEKKYDRIINNNQAYLFAINKNQLDIYDKNMALSMNATIPQKLIDKDFYLHYDSLSGAFKLDYSNKYYFLNQNTKQFSRSYNMIEYKSFDKKYIVYNYQDENDEDGKSIYYIIDKNGEVLKGANNNISSIYYEKENEVISFTYKDEKIELYNTQLNNILPLTVIETVQYDKKNKLIYIETKNTKNAFYITTKGKKLEK